MRRTLPAILLALSLSGFGCTSGSNRRATINLVPQGQEQTQRFVQRFSDSYAVQRDNGSTDIVLTDLTSDGLDQYLHLRLLWRPMHGTKTDQPSTTNAIIDWYVFSNDDQRKFLRYTGAGLVTANPKGRDIRVTVKNATLRLAGRRGDMVDPLGPSTLTGKFTAPVDAARVDRTLSELQAVTRDPVASSTDDNH